MRLLLYIETIHSIKQGVHLFSHLSSRSVNKSNQKKFTPNYKRDWKT